MEDIHINESIKRLSRKELNEYKKSLKMAEVEEGIDLVFYRPIAFILVKLIYKTKVTPDQLTLTAIFMGLISGILYSFGLPITGYIGAFFYFSFIIFDCSDGQLARLKKNGTPFGRLLDGIADYFVVTAIYIGIAIGYSNQNIQPHMLFLLILSAVSIIIQEVLVDYYRTRFLDIVMSRNNTFEEGIREYRNQYIKLKIQKDNWFKKSVIYIYLVYSKIQRSLTTKKKREEFYNADPKDYYKKNRILIRLWVFMGPSAMRTTLMICSIFTLFHIYFWITIGVFNILAVILWIIQRQIDKTYVILPKE
jgi:phosphatidylglycerophosphate synthase